MSNLKIFVGEIPQRFYHPLSNKLAPWTLLVQSSYPFQPDGKEAFGILDTVIETRGVKWFQRLINLSKVNWNDHSHVLVDQVEFGLHPRHHAKVVQWIRSQSNEDRSIFVTTNASHILDAAHPDELRRGYGIFK